MCNGCSPPAERLTSPVEDLAVVKSRLRNARQAPSGGKWSGSRGVKEGSVFVVSGNLSDISICDFIEASGLEHRNGRAAEGQTRSNDTASIAASNDLSFEKVVSHH